MVVAEHLARSVSDDRFFRGAGAQPDDIPLALDQRDLPGATGATLDEGAWGTGRGVHPRAMLSGGFTNGVQARSRADLRLAWCIGARGPLAYADVAGQTDLELRTDTAAEHCTRGHRPMVRSAYPLSTITSKTASMMRVSRVSHGRDRRHREDAGVQWG